MSTTTTTPPAASISPTPPAPPRPATPARNVEHWVRLHAGNAYFNNHPRYQDRLHTLGVERILSLLDPQPDDILLEIGCGYGRLLHHLLPRVRAVIGVDLADEPLAEARRLLATHNRPDDVTLIRNDGLTLAAIPDDSVTAACAFTVLQHMTREGARGYVREAARVLAPGRGRLCLQFHSINAPITPADSEILDLPAEQSIIYTPAQACELVQSAGLRIDRLEREDLDPMYPGAGFAWLWLLATKPTRA